MVTLTPSLAVEIRPGEIHYFWLLADEPHDEETRNYFDGVSKEHGTAGMACPLPGSWQDIGDSGRRHRVRVIDRDGQPRRYTVKEIQYNCADDDVADDTAEIDRLARMSELDCERLLHDTAKRMGLRSSKVLKSLVNKRRSKIASKTPNQEPWDQPVNGVDLLIALVAILKAHAVLSDHAAITIALWVLAAHIIEATDIFPFLAINSPVKRCGKTTLLGILRELVPKPLSASNVTAASIYTAVEANCPTLIIDDFDTLIGSKPELRNILNAGHNRRFAWVMRVVAKLERRYSVYSPKVIGLIGRLPDTIQDRSVVISMRRKLVTETVERFRQDKIEKFVELSRKCARWAKDNLEAIKASDPEAVAGINDRANDNWRILFAVADVCGADWGTKAREAALAIEPSPAQQATLELREQPEHVRLLADCKKVYDETGAEELSAKNIIQGLCNLPESEWAEWKYRKPISERAFAELLGHHFKISSEKGGPRMDRMVWKRKKFEPEWLAYVPPDVAELAEGQNGPAPHSKARR